MNASYVWIAWITNRYKHYYDHSHVPLRGILRYAVYEWNICIGISHTAYPRICLACGLSYLTAVAQFSGLHIDNALSNCVSMHEKWPYAVLSVQLKFGQEISSSHCVEQTCFHYLLECPVIIPFGHWLHQSSLFESLLAIISAYGPIMTSCLMLFL